ncbi:collagen alpha-1(I) chain-like [Canis lupus familiaris]|uniref:collagen alpha-1(I) chain-like n=1 Tax=Canis lupus familiaris TaxID=9615 RepID=UPI0018F7D171|nr:collagen alpha-1(I) chain-like [Canis lupus familiaris]
MRSASQALDGFPSVRVLALARRLQLPAPARRGGAHRRRPGHQQLCGTALLGLRAPAGQRAPHPRRGRPRAPPASRLGRGTGGGQHQGVRGECGGRRGGGAGRGREAGPLEALGRGAGGAGAWRRDARSRGRGHSEGAGSGRGGGGASTVGARGERRAPPGPPRAPRGPPPAAPRTPRDSPRPEGLPAHPEGPRPPPRAPRGPPPPRGPPRTPRPPVSDPSEPRAPAAPRVPWPRLDGVQRPGPRPASRPSPCRGRSGGAGASPLVPPGPGVRRLATPAPPPAPRPRSPPPRGPAPRLPPIPVRASRRASAPLSPCFFAVLRPSFVRRPAPRDQFQPGSPQVPVPPQPRGGALRTAPGATSGRPVPGGFRGPTPPPCRVRPRDGGGGRGE